MEDNLTEIEDALEAINMVLETTQAYIGVNDLEFLSLMGTYMTMKSIEIMGYKEAAGLLRHVADTVEKLEQDEIPTHRVLH